MGRRGGLWACKVDLIIMALGQTFRLGPPLAAILINYPSFNEQCHNVRFELDGCIRVL